MAETLNVGGALGSGEGFICPHRFKAAWLVCILLLSFQGRAAADPPQFQVTRIGLTDAEHTRNNGYQYSGYASMTGGTFRGQYNINSAGHVIGNAQRYGGGGFSLGRSAWLYTGTQTINIGMTDAAHTSTTGRRYSNVTALNVAGQAVGYAERYDIGLSQFGSYAQTAWIWNGTTTTALGLTDSQHQSSTGYMYNEASAINSLGYVVGHSNRFNGGSSSLGFSSWLYNGTSTVRIGLVDPEHTGSGGLQHSYSLAHYSIFHDNGHVIGTSQRYLGGGASLGYSAWLYNGTGTVNVGLTGAGFARDDGYRFSNVRAINAAGQVVG